MSLVTQRMEEHDRCLRSDESINSRYCKKPGLSLKKPWLQATKSSFAAMAAAPPTRSTWLLKSSVVFRKNGRPSRQLP